MNQIILEDESLRDGLQFEKTILSLEDKIQIFNGLVDAGVQRIQAGSFVHPKIVPQMADTDEFISKIVDTKDVLVTGLVLNQRGFERAQKCGLIHISVGASVSDAHSKKNTEKNSNEALDTVLKIIKEATSAGISVRAGTQCAFGCVYEGSISKDKIIKTASKMAEAGATELNLADTTGMANPLAVKELVAIITKELPHLKLSLHLHDTRGLAIANMMAGYEAGVRLFDTSVGGLGGCPVVKGATGNIATEDAANLFESIGEPCEIDIKKLCLVTAIYEKKLRRTLPGRMSRVLSNCSC